MREGGSPSTVVASLSARKAARSGVLWGYIFGIAIASSEISYVKIYKTAAQRDALAATYGSNKAMSALFGPAHQLQTVTGFTVFKISMTLMILGAVWGLLTSTKLLRGEEDSGRWHLLLVGQTTRARRHDSGDRGLRGWRCRPVGGHRDHRGPLGRGLECEDRRRSFAFPRPGHGGHRRHVPRRWCRDQPADRHPSPGRLLGGRLLGVSYALRLIADAGVGLHWLIWTSPLGWVEELQPLTSPRPLALWPIVAFTAVLVAVAVTSPVRDVGESILPDRAHSEAHLGLLFGPTGLAIRLMRERSSAGGWPSAYRHSSTGS